MRSHKTSHGSFPRLLSLIILSILLWTGLAAGGTRDTIDPLVLQEIDRAGEARFLVYLHEKANLSGAARLRDWSRRGYFVYDLLRDTAARTQAPLRELLDRRVAQGQARDVTSYWICNALAVTGDKETVLALAARPEVERIAANRQIQVLDPAEAEEVRDTPLAVEWNIAQVRADQVWNTYDIIGRGVTVGSMDTGVDLSHPALRRQYRGWSDGRFDHNHNWVDATPLGGRVPYDSAMHGTHTMGTVLGDDGTGQPVGVAPGARWIAALIIGPDLSTWVEAAHKGFQWMLAPTDLDGNNPDPDRRPAVVNNSWACRPGTAGCSPDLYLEFWDDVTAWVDAGIVPEFSAGNSGPDPLTMGWPADYPSAFATGATTRNDDIARFSSRGPSQYDESVKPNVCAPGENVRSAIPGGRYGLMSGTSSAGPHVVGLVALLLEANPQLTVGELQTIIQDTAVPLGAERPNNTFGWGRIDARAAVEAALLRPR